MPDRLIVKLNPNPATSEILIQLEGGDPQKLLRVKSLKIEADSESSPRVTMVMYPSTNYDAEIVIGPDQAAAIIAAESVK
jgi:hypothetical protein